LLADAAVPCQLSWTCASALTCADQNRWQIGGTTYPRLSGGRGDQPPPPTLRHAELLAEQQWAARHLSLQQVRRGAAGSLAELNQGAAGKEWG